MTSVLKGIKVIEMGHWVAVPAAAAMFADWGAEVIKIEPPSGDALRYQYPLKKDLTPDTEGVNWRFEVHNRNKKSIMVNLASQEGIDIAHRLIKNADIFLANYEQDALNKFRLDFNTLSAHNPRLVYAMLTGYGQTGPDKDERGFDFTAAWARTGIQYLLGGVNGPPPANRTGAMDRVVSLSLAAGIMAALVNRERTGKGRRVDFSLYDTGIWMEAIDLQMTLTGNSTVPENRASAANPLVNTYRTSDDRWIQLAMLQMHAYLDNLCRALGRPELASDPRFPADDLATFTRNRIEFIRILDEIFASKPLMYWEAVLKEHHCIFSRVCTPEEVISDPQALANEAFIKIDHPLAGPTALVNTPVKFAGDPVEISSTAPELGEHTENVLLDHGFSWEEIARFKEKGVIP